ncbi:MAG: lysylphosphatidylglycerol synthase transmembrane domain-containing protein [Bryobacteraceae bacterium]
MAVLAIAIVIYRWQSSAFQWSVFAATLTHVRSWWMLLAVVLCLATYAGRALRWQVMVRPIKADPSLWNILAATVIGFTAIVLFGRPGELVRPYLIAAKEKLSFSSQIAAWMLERIYDLLLVLVIFGISLSQISSSHVQTGPAIGWILRVGGYIVGFAGFACLFLLFLFSRLSPAGEQRFLDALRFLPPVWYSRTARFLTAFLQGMQSTRSLGFVAQLLLYTFLEWSLIAASITCLFRAFPATAGFSLADVFVFVGFVSFGSVVQIPGIGGGMQVAAIVIFTELFHLSLEVSTSLALVVWLFSFVVVVPFGLLLAFHQGVQWRKLRQLETEPPAL